MNYPLISEYIEAIKTAEDNFDQLKHPRPVNDDFDEQVKWHLIHNVICSFLATMLSRNCKLAKFSNYYFLLINTIVPLLYGSYLWFKTCTEMRQMPCQICAKCLNMRHVIKI